MSDSEELGMSQPAAEAHSAMVRRAAADLPSDLPRSRRTSIQESEGSCAQSPLMAAVAERAKNANKS
jgi:hypothetical protein